MYQFDKALPVWGEGLTWEYNQVLGFRADVEAPKPVRMKIALAARTYYRLYVNGEIVANGPARTAKGFCRVDEFIMPALGRMQLAIEVIAIDKPLKYSNDNTMEPGLLAAEISFEEENGRWKTAAATGEDCFGYTELLYRISMAELMSHSRGIVEYYRLEENSFSWITGDYSGFKKPVPLKEKVGFLERRSPYPTYRPIPFQRIQKVKNMEACDRIRGGIVYELAQSFNPDWYRLLKEEDRFIAQLLEEREVPFAGSWHKNISGEEKKICVSDCHGAAAFVFSIPKSELGFIHFKIKTEADMVIDVVNSDHTDKEGVVRGNTYAVRYELKRGSYCLTTFEPKLTRYIKLIIRSCGKVFFSYPQLWDYSYPEEESCMFECSDGELNLIYEGAKRTLRLNTLDIFMDCPQRERGGWLCDSQFTSQAAWQLLGDLRVEKDFIENFMLTNPEDYLDAFFPEVYPGVNYQEKSPGIQSWSFWLLTELWDYYWRSADRKFIDSCFGRVEKLLDAVMNHVGESGLFEGFDTLFVDWSLSNEKFSLYPISIPVNCLIVHAFELMGELYHVERWTAIAQKVRKRIEGVRPVMGLDSDGYSFENGRFIKNGCLTEAGLALELWSGFRTGDPAYVRPFTEEMGTCPRLRPNPNIGRANLFIGLMIRFDVLAKLGKTDTLVKELKDVYLPELLHGAGTLYENINAFSGCHGFNGMAGALIVNQVLGLGQPFQLTHTVRINPHPGELNWACGNAVCEEGDIYLEWHADHEAHVLDMELTLPEGWTPEVVIPFELSGWKVYMNGKCHA